MSQTTEGRAWPLLFHTEKTPFRVKIYSVVRLSLKISLHCKTQTFANIYIAFTWRTYICMSIIYKYQPNVICVFLLRASNLHHYANCLETLRFFCVFAHELARVEWLIHKKYMCHKFESWNVNDFTCRHFFNSWKSLFTYAKICQ